MKKRTKNGGWEPMEPWEETVMLISFGVACALCGVALYKLYHLIF